MLGQIWNRGWELCLRSPTLKRLVVREWYNFFSGLNLEGHVLFMNYGYGEANADLDLRLDPADEGERYSLQMYHHVATQVDIRELDVLEVGCGRGGGASYLMRHLHPCSYTAMDISSRAIAFCREHYHLPGLSFLKGDAEQIEFPDARFQVVLNIESSSHYGDMEKFFAEVNRVLQPGGFFLYADIWQPNEVPLLKQRFAGAGLVLRRCQDMTPAVLVALDRDEERKRELIERCAPGWMHGAFLEFTGTPGSTKYEDFRTGRVQYLCCLLQKLEREQPTETRGQTPGTRNACVPQGTEDP